MPGRAAVPADLTPFRRFSSGLPAAYIQGYGNLGRVLSRRATLAVRAGRLAPRATLTVKVGVRYQRQFWPNTRTRCRASDSYRFPSDGNNVGASTGGRWDPTGTKRTAVHAAYGMFYDNHITGLDGITGHPRRRTERCPHAGRPASGSAVARRVERAAAAGSPKRRSGAFPALKFIIDSGARDACTRITPRSASTARSRRRAWPSRRFRLRAREGIRLARSITTRLCRRSARAAAARRRRRRRHLGVDPPVHVVRRDLVSRIHASRSNKRFSRRHQLLRSYTLSKAEDNSTDLSERVHSAEERARTRSDRTRPACRIGFDPQQRTRTIDAGSTPQVRAQRHFTSCPAGLQLSTIVTAASGRPVHDSRRRRSQWRRQTAARFPPIARV